MDFIDLPQAITREFGDDLAQPVEFCRDAIFVRLRNEVVLELRVASDAEYCIAWRWGDALWRIDTAPLHPQLATVPQHLHDSTGAVRADPLTRPADPAWDNVRRVIAAVVRDPLLQESAAV